MKKLQYIFLLFSAVYGYSQVNLVPLIEDKVYKVDQKFTLTFILEVNGENLVQQTKIRLPDFSKFERLGSGSEQKTLFTENETINQIIYQQVLSPKYAGKLKIGSALVTINGKIYKTEPFEIEVEEADKNVIAESPTKLKNDLFLNLEIEDKEVYQNEPTVAILRAYSKNINNFRKVKNVKLPSQNNVEFSAVNYNKADIEFSKTKASSQILAIFLIFPEKSGNVQLQPVSANYSADVKKLLSNKVKIKVKNLPKNAPADFKNAVGEFNIDFSTDKTQKIEVNKPINIRLTISGEGNMKNLQLPKIKESELYDVFAPKIVKNIKVGEAGIVGEIFADYILVPKKAGELSIFTEAFSYFNPKDRKYTDLGVQKIQLNVVSQEQILADRTPLERVNAYTNNVLETVDNPVMATKTLKVEQNNQINWNTSLLNLILFCSIIGILLLINNYQKNKKKIRDDESEIRAFTSPDIKEIMNVSELENTFGYLKRMFREKDFSEIFITINNLDHKFRNAYNVAIDGNFPKALEEINGSKTADEYRNLSQKIEIERFAPLKNEEQVGDLVNDTIIFYTKLINK